MTKFWTKHKKQIGMWLMTVLTLCVMLFIFSNSAKDGTESSAQSDFVVKLVFPIAEALLPVAGIKPTYETVSSAVRTLGHFSEFALLGCVSFFTVRLRTDKKSLRAGVPFGFSVVTAFADEAIQLTSPGRAWQFSDILVDSAGAACGMLFAVLCVCTSAFFTRKRRRV